LIGTSNVHNIEWMVVGIGALRSRCGIDCSVCERRERVGCKGCMNMDAPFWGGVCQVKSCCEDRGSEHCGLCEEFPCPMLSEMGKEQGYDPAPRLKRCLEWSRDRGS
jgi:hypothetical protein